MGYPVITRLGINQFWYRYWNSSLNYNLQSQQFRLLELFLKSYLKYGLLQHNNIFFHEYWFAKKYKFKRTLKHYHFSIKYFRQAYLTDHIVGTKVKFLIRKNTFEYFPMRSWFFKYGGWIVIMVKWFIPNKFANPKYYRQDIYKSVVSLIPLYKESANADFIYYKRLRYLVAFLSTTKSFFNYKL